jgi:hypothetical protein
MSSEDDRRAARHCLPGCDRLDGHDGRDAGACMGAGGGVLYPGPLDLEHRHPDIPVNVPARRVPGEPGVCEGAIGPLAQTGVFIYDMVPPKWPDDAVPWTPYRNRLPRASQCYSLPSGNKVHVKPGCRC